MSGLYDSARESFLLGDLEWDAFDTRVILMDDADHTTNLATDDFLDDIAAGARVAVSGAMSGKTTTDGTADASDDSPTFSAVSGDVSEELVIYYHTGVDGTSSLIVNIDSATGLPVTPNGGDITVQWDNGADKIFTL